MIDSKHGNQFLFLKACVGLSHGLKIPNVNRYLTNQTAMLKSSIIMDDTDNSVHGNQFSLFAQLLPDITYVTF